MPVNPDFRDLFASLNEEKVKYLLVGGYAVAFYDRPRFTKDLDVWVEAGEENAARVFKALERFGAPMRDLSLTTFRQTDIIFQIGVPPNRIDILTSIDGVAFEEAWEGREASSYGNQTIFVIGKTHLIRNKRASGRGQDLLDAGQLEENSDSEK